jgi:hypothetical protein
MAAGKSCGVLESDIRDSWQSVTLDREGGKSLDRERESSVSTEGDNQTERERERGGQGRERVGEKER